MLRLWYLWEKKKKKVILLWGFWWLQKLNVFSCLLGSEKLVQLKHKKKIKGFSYRKQSWYILLLFIYSTLSAHNSFPWSSTFSGHAPVLLLYQNVLVYLHISHCVVITWWFLPLIPLCISLGKCWALRKWSLNERGWGEGGEGRNTKRATISTECIKCCYLAASPLVFKKLSSIRLPRSTCLSCVIGAGTGKQ